MEPSVCESLCIQIPDSIIYHTVTQRNERLVCESLFIQIVQQTDLQHSRDRLPNLRFSRRHHIYCVWENPGFSASFNIQISNSGESLFILAMLQIDLQRFKRSVRESLFIPTIIITNCHAAYRHANLCSSCQCYKFFCNESRDRFENSVLPC